MHNHTYTHTYTCTHACMYPIRFVHSQLMLVYACSHCYFSFSAKMTSTSGRVYAKAFFYNFPSLKETYDFCNLLSYLDNMQCLLPAGRWQIYCMNKHHILTTGDAHFKYSFLVKNSVLPVSIIVMYIYTYLNYRKFMVLRPKNNHNYLHIILCIINY